VPGREAERERAPSDLRHHQRRVEHGISSVVADAVISAAELTLLATLRDTAATALSDYVFGF
jgi:hypothetical protein